MTNAMPMRYSGDVYLGEAVQAAKKVIALKEQLAEACAAYEESLRAMHMLGGFTKKSVGPSLRSALAQDGEVGADFFEKIACSDWTIRNVLDS